MNNQTQRTTSPSGKSEIVVRLFQRLCLTAVWLLFSSSTCAILSKELLPAPSEGTAKKIVLIAGELDWGHPRGTHEYQKTILQFASDLQPLSERLNFEIEIHLNGWPRNPATLDSADTIVLISNGSDRNEAEHPFFVDDRLSAIDRQMRRGCGLVLVHWSTFWPARDRDKVLDWVGGYFDYESGPQPRRWFSKIKTAASQCRVAAPSHPIARGVRDYSLREELYYNLQFSNHPHSTLVPIISANIEGEPAEQTVAWAFQRAGQGRGFAYTGGHFFEHWRNDSQRRMLGNAILWTAGIDPPPRGIPFQPAAQRTPPHVVDVLDADKINVALITGHQHPAHDWRSTSQVLLDGLVKDSRIAVTLTEDPEFLADPRMQDYDAILLNYCNWQRAGLSEEAKKGFVKFLKRGGGLVLVHFANGAFHFSLPDTPESDWPEYRNICRRVWDHTPGKSGHDAFGKFTVQITNDSHPITAGMESFETVDELYFRQQGDAPIEVLATARSEVTGRDEPLVFVYEYGGGRVFQTLLGHSGQSLRVPQVSKLLRRAVTWVAKREVREPAAATFEPDYLAKWTPKRRRDSRFPYEDEGEDDWMDDRFQFMDKGPFYSSSIDAPGHGMTPKAIAVRFGNDPESAVLFDTQTLNWRVGWTGGFLNFPPNRFGILAMPSVSGEIQFSAPQDNRWRTVENKESQTDRNRAMRFRGLFAAGHRVVFSYRIGNVDILDSFGVVETPLPEPVFRRDLNFSQYDPSWELPIIGANGASFEIDDQLFRSGRQDGLFGHGFPSKTVAISKSGKQVTMVAVSDGELVVGDQTVAVRNVDAAKKMNQRNFDAVSVFVWHGSRDKLESVVHALGSQRHLDLKLFTDLQHWAATSNHHRNAFGATQPHNAVSEPRDPFSARWGKPLLVEGRTSHVDAGLVVDTITVPYQNPYNALMFTSGVDFLADGRAAVCTVHGDVWLVGGIDADLNQITWQRFATGLYQPLGLKVVDNQVYVLGRDRITRLHDLDDDGEADYYENFDDQLHVTGQPHGYAMSLETDPQGRFYFIKSGGPGPHGGTMLRLTPAPSENDQGNQLEVYATGYRHANGLGVSPRGVVTSADNEGNWVPATRIDIVKRGGFYGHMPTHWRDTPPQIYDGPLCWIPRELDNSAGGQVWVTSDAWGPLQDKMLHLSFGRCTLNLVLRQTIDAVDQAGVMRLPLPAFLSGSMRGRFNPRDGHLYVVGLDGWQTAAVRDGCFQRVRATGKPVYLPTDLKIIRDGLEIAFSQPLDPSTAVDKNNWTIQQWNYRWTQEYGSEHYRVSDPQAFGHDLVTIDEISISADGRTVRLTTDRLQRVMQMNIQANLRAADGQPMPCDLFNTIHAVPR